MQYKESEINEMKLKQGMNFRHGINNRDFRGGYACSIRDFLNSGEDYCNNRIVRMKEERLQESQFYKGYFRAFEDVLIKEVIL